MERALPDRLGFAAPGKRLLRQVFAAEKSDAAPQRRSLATRDTP
jgi:hypothetical protein